MEVTDGGRVAITGDLYCGLFGQGTLTVDGEDESGRRSVLMARTIEVGGDIPLSEMTVANGAMVKSDVGVVGKDAGEDGTVIILGHGESGAGSIWDLAQELTIGDQGSGRVEVRGKAIVFVDGNTTVGNGAAGVLHLDDGTAVVQGDLIVGVPGVVEGNGTLHVSGTVNNAGSISPGLSPGRLEIDGDFEQRDTGTLVIEIAGVQPDTQFDVLAVRGDAALGGTLEVRFIDGFAPRAGDAFAFLPVGGDPTGDFAEKRILGLAPGFTPRWEAGDDGTYRLIAVNDGVPTTAPPCPGDCNADGAVTVDELVRAVNEALGVQLLSCRGLDANHDVLVTVDEVIVAVRSALDGCPSGERSRHALLSTAASERKLWPSGRYWGM